MKLRKPIVSASQTALKLYVASLLLDRESLVEDPIPVDMLVNKKTPSSGVELAQCIDTSIKLTARLTGNFRSENSQSKQSITAGENGLCKGADKRELNQSVSRSTDTDGSSRTLKIASLEQANPAPAPSNQPVVQLLAEYAEPETAPSDPRLKNVEKLLSQIALAKIPPVSSKSDLKNLPEVDAKATNQSRQNQQTKEAVEQDNRQLIATMEASFEHRENTSLKDELGSVFQTLVFEVNSLPLAVPLIKLGGIVDLADQVITPLVGTPDWFLGLVSHERGNLLVVDTQRFLMPEREQAGQPDYRFLILLDDSQWAIACHSVDDAKNLLPEDIRWSARTSKRPWFAGMVVEYMSALIEVDELINMLADNLVD